MTSPDLTIRSAGGSNLTDSALPAVPDRDDDALPPSGSSDLRNALLCGLAVVAAMALTQPIANAPFNDDWSYSFTVKRLLETGKLTYNGWASASLIAQAYWGLIWVKAFGFSYTVLRLSTLPLAAAAISLCYLLGRHAGLRPRFAVFASLMLGLSPLYLPVACTFMTDAPGLFCIMLSMYAIIRAIESPRTGPIMGWMMMGLVVGFVGGTSRQIVWLVPLVLAPYAAWLRRDNLPALVCGIAGWVLVLAGALLTLRWFNHQPFSIPENSIRSDLKLAWHHKAHYLVSVLAIGLTLLWVILPSLWGLFRNWNTTRAVVALILFIGPAVILPTRPRYALAPWMSNTLAYNGVMDGAELPGTRPVTMPKLVRILSAVAVFAVACVLLADLLIWLARPFRAIRKTVRLILFPNLNEALIPAMFLFALAYCVLLLPRCATNMVYDRYLLPLMPCVLFPILLGYQREGDRRVAAPALLLFGIYTLYAIGITQDVTALARARTAAVNHMLAGGVQRVQIDAGFEYDFQTQLDARGYINDQRLRIPPGVYIKNVGPTPALQPIYRIEYAPAPDTVPTRFGFIPYISYIYPFHRRVYIDQYADPWWLNPREAATHPADSYHHFMPLPGSMSDDDAKP